MEFLFTGTLHSLMVTYLPQFLSGFVARRFLLKCIVTPDAVTIGLEAARLTAREVLGNPEAVVIHGHGPRGSDVSSRGNFWESEYKTYLLSNRNNIVGKNVAKYKKRSSPESGLLVATAIRPVQPAESLNSSPARNISIETSLNKLAAVEILVVQVTHEVGAKHEVSARDLVEVARKAVAEKFPGQGYEELDREEFLRLHHFHGLQAVDEHLDATDAELNALNAKVDSMKADIEEIKNLLKQSLRK